MYSTVFLLQRKLTNIMRGKLVCISFNISTWASINRQLDAWLDKKIDRSMSRVVFVFPYRTLNMMPVPQSLMFIIDSRNPINHFLHSLESIYSNCRTISMGIWLYLPSKHDDIVQPP